MTDLQNKNVYQKPLQQAARDQDPLPGVGRDGFCRVPRDDTGNHSVAATVTDEFLDFTASRGNDLRKQVPGLKGGMRWCLCASRWKEAFDAKNGDQDPKVPVVKMDATCRKALEVIDFKDLKRFAQPPEAQNASKSAQWPDNHPDSMVRESKEIGGKEPRA